MRDLKTVPMFYIVANIKIAQKPYQVFWCGHAFGCFHKAFGYETLEQAHEATCDMQLLSNRQWQRYYGSPDGSYNIIEITPDYSFTHA